MKCTCMNKYSPSVLSDRVVHVHDASQSFELSNEAEPAIRALVKGHHYWNVPPFEEENPLVVCINRLPGTTHYIRLVQQFSFPTYMCRRPKFAPHKHGTWYSNWVPKSPTTAIFVLSTKTYLTKGSSAKILWMSVTPLCLK
jgi:hypothetical protein